MKQASVEQSKSQMDINAMKSSSVVTKGIAVKPPDYGIAFLDAGTGPVIQPKLAMSPANAARFGKTIQRRSFDEEEEPLQGKFAPGTAAVLQKKDEPTPNRTGLPDNLKYGIEALSGLALDNVRVHYNSHKPAQLQALAYTQGTDIHVASGQERHLPHEAWHVVQQKQGKVTPTIKLKAGLAANNDIRLEEEADVMGMKASQPGLQEQSSGIVKPVMHGHQNNTMQFKLYIGDSSEPKPETEATLEEAQLNQDNLIMNRLRDMINSPDEFKYRDWVQAIVKIQSANRIRNFYKRMRIGGERRRKAQEYLRVLINTTERFQEFNKGMPKAQYTDYKMTNTAGGAWLANQLGFKTKIGPVDEYMGSSKDPNSRHAQHLLNFQQGAHAFITAKIHKCIHGMPGSVNFGGWGIDKDANFVSTLASADKLIGEAAKEGGRGIFHLEEKLGVPTEQWVNECAPDYHIFRYIVRDPGKFNIRIPSGNESKAYGPWWKGEKDGQGGTYVKGQWVPKGSTEGGELEAVIDSIRGENLKKAQAEKSVEIIEDTSLETNTKRVIAEQELVKKT